MMQSPVQSVGVHDFVDDAVWWLTSNRVTAAAVLDDDGRLVGMVSASHLASAWLEAQFHPIRAYFAPIWRQRCQTVGEVMSTPVASLTPGADLHQVRNMFQDRACDYVLVVDGLSVMGIISRSNLRQDVEPE